MVAITAVYVVATILICQANIRSAKATREQLAEAKRQFEENNRAFVAVAFEVIKSGLAVLHVQNHGKRKASNVKIRVFTSSSSNIVNKNDKQNVEKISEYEFALGIGQSWYIYIGNRSELEKISNKLLSIEISYEDFNSKYNEITEIDIKQYFHALLYESPTENLYQEMKKLTKSVQSIDKSIRKILGEE